MAAGGVVPLDRPVLILLDAMCHKGPAAFRVLHAGVAAAVDLQADELAAAFVRVDLALLRRDPLPLRAIGPGHEIQKVALEALVVERHAAEVLQLGAAALVAAEAHTLRRDVEVCVFAGRQNDVRHVEGVAVVEVAHRAAGEQEGRRLVEFADHELDRFRFVAVVLDLDFDFVHCVVLLSSSVRRFSGGVCVLALSIIISFL